MSINRKGLGKGIGSLIGDYDSSTFEVKKLEESGAKVVDIDIKNIKPNPNQPRKTFDTDLLNELKDSIESNGVIIPLIVEEIAKDSYIIVAGERRYRASKMAGLKTVPCIVRSFSDMQRMEVALIENIQREDLNPVEEARAYSYLITNQGIKQEDLAKRVGKSRSTITNSIRLLNLPEKMLDSLSEGKFSAGHARAILSVENPADREILYSKIMKDSISVRQAEALATQLNNGSRAKNEETTKILAVKTKPEEIMEIEDKFLQATGCKVEVKGKISKGKLIIPYTNTKELERIYQMISRGDILFEDSEEI